VTLELDVQVAIGAEAQHDCQVPLQQTLERWVRAALEPDNSDAQLTLRIVDERECQQLNRQYRHKDEPTNVLSFPFEAPPGVPVPLLGDVVICAPVVAREAREQGKTAEAHWCHLVVHGVLHLLGFDHMEEDQAQLMEDHERRILEKLGFADPYQEFA
jgi:probable rRNA maturation factor